MTARPPPARAVLFDLDGTLLDTATDMIAAINALLAEHRRAPLDFAATRPLVSHGAIRLVGRGFPEAAGAEFERLRLRFLDLYSTGLARHTRLFPGFDALLRTFESRALPWGVVTNKPGWLTDPLLAALGLEARAACVISGDTLPERKPHPLPLLTAAARIGVAPGECLYVGDALRDVQAARAAGMRPIGVRFGYLDPGDDPAGWQVEAWIDQPHELLSWLAPCDDCEAITVQGAA